ncbi:hypothetical protein M3181_19940 [Mesobacillus maritimus]|uniref:hypothetical protein n=1 Tax=Mesobacillus maritimus TaxID=1643336 RepID=UPI00203D1D41|nr:hypothetical protein [Mesobacillus maritimus]MCM3671234.1 hypothetical protein [Mesobacillus maritimus]
MKKLLISTLALTLASTSLLPYGSAKAASIETNNSVNPTTVIQTSVAPTSGILTIKAINELDQKLDMENLTSNSQDDINQLSTEAKRLYESILIYANQKNGPLKSEDMLVVLNNYVHSSNTTNATNTIQPMLGGINYKEYKISNSDIQKLNDLVGLNGGFWATATAIAKIWGKNPTVLTLMLGALPMLGVGGLNLCNSKKKGVIITKIGSGATNSYSCRSQ